MNRLSFMHFGVESVERKRKEKKRKKKEWKKRKGEREGGSVAGWEKGRQQLRKRKEEAAVHHRRGLRPLLVTTIAAYVGFATISFPT